MDGTCEGGQGPAERPTFPTVDGVKGVFASNGSSEPAEDEIPAATHWPSIPVADLADEWNDLRAWVVELKVRFDSVDHHVVPNCWWRHNEHVEALAALQLDIKKCPTRKKGWKFGCKAFRKKEEVINW